MEDIMGGVTTTQPRNRAAKFFGEPRGNLIGKDVVPAITGETVRVLDPATGELLMTTPASSRHDVDRAVAAAQQAFESGPWRRLTPFERGRIIAKLADL